MQQQVQIQRTYSFEEICPTWSRLLADNGGFIENLHVRYESLDGDLKSLTEPNSCIVGEAHNL